MRPTVEVSAEWRSNHRFEFKTEAEAEKFAETINEGGDAAFKALIEAGDVDSSIAELVDFRAH